ncbi:MAG: S24 family peptidase [Candidatus Marithrix sp.]|nr:S24 family peptidase [Candidatus Marithrix sp.]
MNNCGREPFALQVLGDSMLPEFKEGNIIIIEPDGVAENGSYVLAMHDEEYIFRQLVIDDNKKLFLKPLNSGYPTLKISSLEDVKGVITQRAGTRRKEHKKYV